MILTISLLLLLLSSLVLPRTHYKENSIHAMKIAEMFSRIFLLSVVAYMVYLLNFYFNLSGDLYLWDGQLKMNDVILWNELFAMVLSIFLLLIGTFKRLEIYMILMTALIGIIHVISSYDLLVTLLSLQLMNISFYLLLGMNKNSEKALSAAFKYLLLSAFTTALFLLGVISLYGLYGTLNYDNLFMLQSVASIGYPILLILGAILFKLGAAPFHFWAPDVYDSTPTLFTAWLITLPKLALLSLLINLFPLITENLLAYFLAPIALLSVCIGSIGLGSQEKVKRLVAFSTISHLGYLIFILLSMDLTSFSFYYTIYLLTTVNVFAILTGSKIDALDQFSGLFMKNPAVALTISIAFFSLAGIPPLLGFFAKLGVIFSLARVDMIFYAILLILTSAISTAYYLKIIKISFLNRDTNELNFNSVEINNAFVISIITSILVFIQFII